MSPDTAGLILLPFFVLLAVGVLILVGVMVWDVVKYSMWMSEDRKTLKAKEVLRISENSRISGGYAVHCLAKSLQIPNGDGLPTFGPELSLALARRAIAECRKQGLLRGMEE